MNERGQYYTNGQSQLHGASRLVHTLELKQRYDNVKMGAVQQLLNTLSREGVVSSVGTGRWEIALKDGAWVMLSYYPDWNALEVTVTDREVRGIDQSTGVRRSYEALLAKITPILQSYGVTTVGAATYAGQAQQPQQQFAARTRAIKAVFDMHSQVRAPYYIYAEVNGVHDKRPASSLDEANAIYFALARSPGDVYVAIFDPTDARWPGPSADTYYTAPQEQPAIVGRFDLNGRGQYGVSSHAMVGLTLYHSVGDRAEAVKQMALDWTALYQDLASQVGVLIADSKSSSGYRYMTQAEWDAKPPDPKKAAWWKSSAEPLIKQWVKFKHDQIGGDRTVADDYISFATRFQTNWEVYEDWKQKLDNLRVEAKKQGFLVGVPKAGALPATVWADLGEALKRGAGGVADELGDTWKFVKYAAWTVLGIGAIVAVSSVAANLRKGEDPADKYVDLIRGSRHSRALRASRTLPSPGEAS